MVPQRDDDSGVRREVRDDIFAVLTRDHREVRAIFDRIKAEMDDETEIARGLFAEVRRELLAHAHAEEEVVYAALAEIDELSDFVDDGREAHALVETVIDEMMSMRAVDDTWRAKLVVLSELVERHVADEERVLEKARPFLAARSAELATRFVAAERSELGPDDDGPGAATDAPAR
jgi:hemerythrin superfamily protein